MNIGLITAVWGGYGRFLPEWLEYVNKSTIKPTEVTIALGENHGADVEQLKQIYPDIKIVYDNDPNPNYGRLANLAIENTDTEWIMPFDVDDLLIPQALEAIKAVSDKADYICIAWRVWWGGKRLYRSSPTPRALAKLSKSERITRRINNNSPFRKSFWEKHPYEENNWQNLKFIADLVESHARFVRLGKECIVYRQWEDSMAKSEDWVHQRPEIIKAALDMYARINKYYET